MTGLELRAALADLGLSQRSFSFKVDVEQSTVSKWCKPDAYVPGYVETIIKLLRQIRDLHHNG
jgi:DNA-binding transcriptional regulator YiaG